ncbi:MAG: hypothetical protein QM802_05495 [Agriterribacter sp.]
MDSLNYSFPREKLFIHTDKPYYRLKDTIWLKGYILTASNHSASDSSKIAYIEIVDATGTVIKRVNPSCELGLFETYIALSEKEFSQGQYTLRSYTRYMRNFGDSLFYTAPFTIIDPANDVWKASIQQLSFDNNRLILSAKLSAAQLSVSDKKPLTIRLRSKNKRVFSATVNPGASGEIVTDTLLNGISDQNLVMEITGGDNIKLSVPVPAGKHDSIDLQFFPEGGHFIAGKEQRLGFKAVNTDGKSIEVNGIIKNSKGKSIAPFSSLHYGMGIVSFIPEAGEIYTAVTHNGYSVTLPPAEKTGISLAVLNTSISDSIAINIDGTADKIGNLTYFAVTCRGIVLARGRIHIKDTAYQLKLRRSDLPSGVIICTVYNEALEPQNERAFFVWQHDDLRISLAPHKAVYTKKDSVSLAIKVVDKNNKPVRGSFSLAVIDTSQVAASIQHQENLLSYMLLRSDISGSIEDADHYFKYPVSNETEALMLTQGWVSYERSTPHLTYEYEKSFSINGNVTNIFNKPLANTGITLFGKAGKNNAFLLDTTTNEKGAFTFDHFPLYETDSISLVLKALNRKGKAFNVGINLVEPDYPAYNGKAPQSSIPGLLKDTAVRKYIAAQDSLIMQMKKDGTFLKEVVIKGRTTIPGSKNLNKDGGADQVIDENTLEKTPKESLLDVLQKQVKGFRTGILPKGTLYRYMVNSNMVRFIIDGVDLEFFYNHASTSSSMDYLEYYKSQLSYFSAEDIKGIEVMNYPRYNSAYRTQFLSLGELMSTGPAKIDYSFIEITTQTGSGPFMRRTPGIYLYKPVFPFISKKFYSPKYSSPDEVTPFPDFRSTIFWEPNIITDEKGEATINFYTSESRSNYLMLIQGIDLNGGIGVQYAPLIVK